MPHDLHLINDPELGQIHQIAKVDTQGQRVCRPGWSARLKLILSYPLYLAEGALWRLRHE